MSASCSQPVLDTLVVQGRLSDDGTSKLTFMDNQGRAFEASLLELSYRKISHVICISTQIGCPFDCRFCAIGRRSFIRNLSTDELLSQISTAFSHSRWKETNEHFEIAAMGTGEPLVCLEELTLAIRKAKRIFAGLVSLNVATVGIPDRIRAYSQVDVEGVDLSLQLSLHGTSDEQRAAVMPLASRFTLNSVLRSCEEFASTHGKTVLANYLLMAGVNDTANDALKLSKLLDRRFFEIKLSILNPIEGGHISGSTIDKVSTFQKLLQENGFQARIFTSCGTDIGAGCGQFSNRPV